MLSDRSTLEAMIQATGGVAVTVGAESTYGHRLTRWVESGRGPEVLVPFTGVKVPAGVVPTSPEGTAVTLGAESWKVHGVDTDEDDGGMTVLLLRRA